MTSDNVWWKDATIYQIWPASYKDSNGDGIGDIPGIITTLDYIKDLGVDIIWLSPMYESPQDDMGYDISDYEAIYPKYGIMKDMDELIEQCHIRGLKLVLDLVINHTSSEHQWFKESRSSKTNPKRNWYIWKPPRYDENGNRLPPNNWRSSFSGSAWEYDDLTDEYYLRLYASTQPDLNWELDQCREAIYQSALTFWYKKGIDGFRIDTARLYSKHPEFPDAPITKPGSTYQPCYMYTSHGPRIHEFHQEMYQKTTSNYDVMTVGEVGACSKEQALEYVSAKRGEMNMLFLFDLVSLGFKTNDRFNYFGFDFKDFKTAIANQCDFIKGTDAWSTVFMENHDTPRSVSRFGNDKEYLMKSAKLLCLLQITLTGTLYIYQGQEIAMTNLPENWDLKEYLDIETINSFNTLLKENNISPDDKQHPLVEKFVKNAHKIARDHARSPVQWNDDITTNSGFSTGTPWMRVNDNYKTINIKQQIKDKTSVLNFYKNCLKLRKQYKPLFIHGDFEILDFDNPNTFSYMKKDGRGRTSYIVLNFSDDYIPFNDLVDKPKELLVTNVDKTTSELSPWEGRVYLVK